MECFLSPIDYLLAGPISCIALPKSEINAGIVNRPGDGGAPALPPACRSLTMWEHSGDPSGAMGAEQMLPSLPHILRVPEVLQASGSGLFIYSKAGSVFP